MNIMPFIEFKGEKNQEKSGKIREKFHIFPESSLKC
jgi:hypothetical protein